MGNLLLLLGITLNKVDFKIAKCNKLRVVVELQTVVLYDNPVTIKKLSAQVLETLSRNTSHIGLVNKKLIT
jgi:hypothetical protein